MLFRHIDLFAVPGIAKPGIFSRPSCTIVDLPFQDPKASCRPLSNVNECMNHVGVIPQKEQRKNNKCG